MYTVKYKLGGSWFWRSIKVKGDAGQSLIGEGHLSLILPDESAVLIPVAGTQFKFSKERHFAILQKMESAAGQKIPLKVD